MGRLTKGKLAISINQSNRSVDSYTFPNQKKGNPVRFYGFMIYVNHEENLGHEKLRSTYIVRRQKTQSWELNTENQILRAIEPQ